MVRAVVNLARAFGQKTIAEGVENQETLEFLKEVGVDYVQGFHIERPRPFHLSSGRGRLNLSAGHGRAAPPVPAVEGSGVGPRADRAGSDGEGSADAPPT